MKKSALIISMISIFTLSSCYDNNEEGRIYSSRDSEECERIKFSCMPGSIPFSDDSGCGCKIFETQNSDRKIRDSDPIILPEKYNINDQDVNNNDLDVNNRDDNESQFNEDPIERNLDSMQEKRLEKD